MNRRVFLRSLGTLSVAGFAAAARPATVQTGANTQRFKVVGSGRLLVSDDGGRTWQPSVNLSPELAVTGLSREGQDIHLALSFQGHSFALRSTDGIRWRTLD